ncbi:unnamed protein product [Tilletia controversa]|nr:unnamed protein product [Tilletia controversa]
MAPDEPKKRRAVDDDDEDDEEELDPDEIERRIADFSDNEDDDDDDDDDNDDDDEDEDVGGRRKKQKRARNKFLDVEAEVDDSDEEIEDEEEGFGPEAGFIDEEDINDNALAQLKRKANEVVVQPGHEIRKGDTMKETEGDSPRNGKEKDPHTGQSKPLAIGGGPGSNFGPAQGRSNMSTPYSSGPNGIMGPPVMPMGGRTPYGGMAPGMGGGGATTYGAAMSGSATAYGGGTGYGGQTAYGNMANGGKTPAYYTSTGGDQVPAYGVNNHGRTPAVGFGGARTPFGAGMGNDGGRTPFQAPGGVTSFAGPGRGLGGATPRAAAAAYGGGTPNWSAGNKTPAHLLAGYGQGASGAATPYHPGGGGDGPSGYQAVADPRRRVQLGGATPMPYYAAPTPAAAATPGAFAAPTPGDLGAAPTPAAAPTPGAPTPAGYNAPTPGGDGAPTPGYSAPTPAVQSYHDGGSTSSNANQRVYPVRDAAVRILRYEDASLVGKIVLVVSPSKAEPVEATCIVRDAGTPGDIEIAVTDVEIVHPTRMKELCVVLHGEWRGSRGTVTETTDSRIVLRMTDQQMLEFPRAHVATVLS